MLPGLFLFQAVMNQTPSNFSLLTAGVIVAGLAVGLLSSSAYGQIAVRNQGYVPFSEPPIDYRGEVNDPVARLQRRLDAGQTTLEWEPRNGYLQSVLDHLRVPISSQTLVFSKTSFQYKKISPQTPRALYFNDDVYVGKVHDGKAIEIVSFDPRQGAVFYLLDEPKADRPVFQRAELDCTTCHVAAGTRNVPGVLIRSIYPTQTGTQAGQTPSYFTGNSSPLAERFGGWYVTGTTGRQVHMGNAVSLSREHPEQLDREGTNITDLSGLLDTSPYLTPHSDIVAQLVQAHQTQMHNLITLTNYRTRIALYEASQENGEAGQPAASAPATAVSRFYAHAEELVRYLVFADEAPLQDRVTGTSGFTEEFAALGPRDRRGRSLREFDLKTRLFRYPVSYLIYTEAFDSLPEPAKSYVYHRLFEILTGRDDSDEFSTFKTADRRAALEILLDTKHDLPGEWQQIDHHRLAATSAAGRPKR